MSLVGHFCFLVLQKRLYVGDVLWGCVAYSPLVSKAVCSRGASCVGCMVLLLWWGWQLKVTGRGGWPPPQWSRGPAFCGGWGIARWQGTCAEIPRARADLLLGGAGSPYGRVHCLRASGYRQPASGWVSPWWFRPAGRFQNGTFQCWCHHRRRSPQSGFRGVSVPSGSPMCFPPLWQSLSDQQVALGLAVWEILCVPFKSGVSVSSSSRGLPAGCQSQIFWGLIFLLQVSLAGKPDVGSDPSLLGEDFCSCDIPSVCGSPTWRV